MKSITVPLDGINLHAMTDGPVNGPLVILLHGFPDFWYSWRFQIPALAAAGFRVMALDQRGYNLSDKPLGSQNYTVRHLTGDIAQAIEKQGGSAAVIGHDWGGAVTWALAMQRPDLVRQFVVINCPHSSVLARHLVSDPKQMLRSWYLCLFQLPRLPEMMIRRNEFKLLTQGMREAGKKGFTEADRQRYLESWRRPGALTAAINWYRGMRHSSPPKRNPKEKVFPPGLLIWGTEDRYLRTVMAKESVMAYPEARLELMQGTSHWAHQQEPQRVNDLLLDFLLP